MSNDLVWSMIKNKSTFLVKRPNGVVFNSEPGNLTNRNSIKFSALGNKKTVQVHTVKKNGKSVITMTTRHGSAQGVKSSTKHTPLVRGSKAAQTIKNATGEKYYRGDLTTFAVARFNALHKASNVKNPTIPTKKVRGGKK